VKWILKTDLNLLLWCDELMKMLYMRHLHIKVYIIIKYFNISHILILSIVLCSLNSNSWVSQFLKFYLYVFDSLRNQEFWLENNFSIRHTNTHFEQVFRVLITLLHQSIRRKLVFTHNKGAKMLFNIRILYLILWWY